MKNIAKLIYFGLLTLLYGCLSGMGEWDITLYEQKIEGTSKSLYKYDAWGGRDSHIAGYAILDTTETFTIPRIKQLSFHQLSEIPNKNLIQTIGKKSIPYEKEKKLEMTFTPLKTQEMNSEGIKVKTKLYLPKGIREKSRGYLQEEFETFKETRDSLFFFNLNNVDSLRIKKGNVIIRQRKDQKIIEIEIKNLILSNDGKDKIISNMRYRLKPKTETKSSEFSNYGIFKEKITVPNTVQN